MDDWQESSSLEWEDEGFEQVLRPQQFSDFVGQERICRNLQVYVEASRKRVDPLDHVLFYGPPGLGKTTLSYIIANELNTPLYTASGPALEKPKDLAAILSRVEKHGVVFIDEIHRMPTSVEEILYGAMEDFQLDIIVGEGPTARSIKLPLPPFTLLGATTRASLLSKPLRDRFGIREKLDYYTDEELARIIEANAARLEVELSTGACLHLAARSRGTPRIAIQLLKRVRDFAEIEGAVGDDFDALDGMMRKIGVDSKGLLPGDLEYLSTLADKFRGGPTGLSTLAAALGDDKDTIESYVEPYLIRQGFLERTPKGRLLTVLGWRHLGRTAPVGTGPLFDGTESS